MAEVRRTAGLAVGAAVGVTTGALLLPERGSDQPVAGLALIVGVALVAGVAIVVVIGVLVTIPSNRRTTNLERLIRAIKGSAGPSGGADRVGPEPPDPPDPPDRPEPPSSTPDPGAADDERPPRPRPAGDHGAAALDGGADDAAVTEPAPPIGRLAWTRRALRGRIYPTELDTPWDN